MTTSKPRLVTRLSEPIDRRLRMTVAVMRPRVPLTEVLEAALAKGLPDEDRLTELMRTGATLDDLAS